MVMTHAQNKESSNDIGKHVQVCAVKQLQNRVFLVNKTIKMVEH